MTKQGSRPSRYGAPEPGEVMNKYRANCPACGEYTVFMWRVGGPGTILTCTSCLHETAHGLNEKQMIKRACEIDAGVALLAQDYPALRDLNMPGDHVKLTT